MAENASVRAKPPYDESQLDDDLVWTSWLDDSELWNVGLEQFYSSA